MRGIENALLVFCEAKIEDEAIVSLLINIGIFVQVKQKNFYRKQKDYWILISKKIIASSGGKI